MHRENLTEELKEILKRISQALANYINGQCVADRVNGIMLKLESNKENLYRRYKLDKDGEVSPTFELNSDEQHSVCNTPKSGTVKRK